MNAFHHRLIAGSLLATFAIGAMAPAAYAGHGRESHRKYRRFEHSGYAEGVDVLPRRVIEYRHRSSGCGSPLAGFLGGVAVGAIISSAAQSRSSAYGSCGRQPAYYPSRSRCDADADPYSYEDPYCHERFSSLDLYLVHARRHCHHAWVAQVIDDRDGGCVDVIRYNGDRWESCDRNDRGGWDYDDEE